MPVMRAKFQVINVTKFENGNENVVMLAVAKSGSYPADGSDEDNTFAKFSPMGRFEIQIANPALFGKIKQGQKFYMDFTEAE